MTLDEAERYIVERMTPEQRAEHEKGCQIVDFYMDMAMNTALPCVVRKHARAKLSAFALRKPGETVADIDGKADQ